MFGRLKEILLSSAWVFADEATVPVLDPGRGAKTGYFWMVARDDRLLGAYRGILQCDGYATDKKLAGPKDDGGAVTLVFCWSHVRRGFYDLAKAGAAPIAVEALARIAVLYRIEAAVRGETAADRLAVRQAKSWPLVAGLCVWFEARVATLPGRGPAAGAVRCALNRWDGFGRFLGDGRTASIRGPASPACRPAWSMAGRRFASTSCVLDVGCRESRMTVNPPRPGGRSTACGLRVLRGIVDRACGRSLPRGAQPAQAWAPCRIDARWCSRIVF